MAGRVLGRLRGETDDPEHLEMKKQWRANKTLRQENTDEIATNTAAQLVANASITANTAAQLVANAFITANTSNTTGNFNSIVVLDGLIEDNFDAIAALDLDDLDDCKVGDPSDTTSVYIGNAPASASGAVANVAVGKTALDAITSGDGNVAIGFDALTANQSALGNTAVGTYALKAATGAHNTGIGYNSGGLIVGGEKNVGVGNYTLTNTTGTGNTSLGYSTGSSITTGDYNVTLGYNAEPPAVGGDTQLTIASTTNGSDAVTWISGDSTGNIGLGGTTAPIAPLHIHPSSDGDPENNAIYVYNTVNSAGRNAILCLRVAGSGGGDPYICFDSVGDGGWSLGMDNSNSNIFKLSSDWNELPNLTKFSVNRTTGNVAIGDHDAGEKLDVDGAIIIGDAAASVNGTIKYDGTDFLARKAGVWVDIAGGGGASSIDGLSDCTVENTSVWIGSTPTNSNGANHCTALGITALDSITSGLRNTAVGYDALTANTVKSDNTAVGYHCMYRATSSFDSTAFGSEAMAASVNAGICCAAFGKQALTLNTANYNSAFGNTSLSKNVGGGYNSAFGASALFNVSGNSRNNAFGAYALMNTTGSGNIGIGYEAGKVNTTGSYNISIGHKSRVNSQTGSTQLSISSSSNGTDIIQWISGNYSGFVGIGGTLDAAERLEVNGAIKIGDTATLNDGTIKYDGTDFLARKSGVWVDIAGGGGASDIDGLSDCRILAGNFFMGNANPPSSNPNNATNNTAIGVTALDSITSASNNTAMGYDALTACSSGTKNTAVGSGALKSTTLGNYNVAIGYEALKSNINASKNIALGYGSLSSNSGASAHANTSIGHLAMFTNSSGSYNVAYGAEASRKNSSGSSNTSIGSYAGRENQTSNYRTAVGYKSLYNSTGHGNTAIGSLAGEDITSQDYCVCIGYDAQVNDSYDSQLVIGSKYNNQQFTWIDGNRNGDIGIGGGTDTSYRLYVTGAMRSTGVAYASSHNTTSDDRMKYNEQNIDPAAALSVINQLNPQKYEKIQPPKEAKGTWIPTDAEWVVERDATIDEIDSLGNHATNPKWKWRNEIGLIAQDVSSIPEFQHCVLGQEVDADGNQTPLHIDYNQIFAYHVAATKELTTQLNAEKVKTTALQTELAAIKTHLGL